jgi:hypothetical protein
MTAGLITRDQYNAEPGSYRIAGPNDQGQYFYYYLGNPQAFVAPEDYSGNLGGPADAARRVAQYGAIPSLTPQTGTPTIGQGFDVPPPTDAAGSTVTNLGAGTAAPPWSEPGPLPGTENIPIPGDTIVDVGQFGDPNAGLFPPSGFGDFIQPDAIPDVTAFPDFSTQIPQLPFDPLQTPSDFQVAPSDWQFTGTPAPAFSEPGALPGAGDIPVPAGFGDFIAPPEIPSVPGSDAMVVPQDTTQSPADVFAGLQDPVAPFSEPATLPTGDIPVPAGFGDLIPPPAIPDVPSDIPVPAGFGDLVQPPSFPDVNPTVDANGNLVPSNQTYSGPPIDQGIGPPPDPLPYGMTPGQAMGVFSSYGPFSTAGVGPQFSSSFGYEGLGFNPNAQANSQVGFSMHPSDNSAYTGTGGEGTLEGFGLGDWWQGWSSQDLQNFVMARRSQGHSGTFLAPSYTWANPSVPEYIPLSTPLLSRQGPGGGGGMAVKKA